MVLEVQMKGIIKAGICILNVIYGILKLFPQQKKIVFLSRQSDSPSIDITMLQDKITELIRTTRRSCSVKS